MAKGFSLSIAADTRDFQRGVKQGIIEPLDDAAEILEDIGREGGRDLQQIERAARHAQRDTDNLSDGFKDLQQEIRNTGRKAKSDFANPAKDAGADVKRELAEVRDEAKANAAEMFSSFDGSFESIGDAAQGTLGGLVSSLGPLGLAAGAAGAAGIGLFMKSLDDAEARAEKQAEIVDQMYSSMLESGLNFLREQDKIDFIDSILGDAEKRAEAQKWADNLGVTTADFLAAQLDLGSKREEVEAAIEERYASQLETMNSLTPGLLEREKNARDVAGFEAKAVEELLKYDAAAKDAAEISSLRRTLVDDIGVKERENISRARSAEQERFDALKESYAEVSEQGPISFAVEADTADAEAKLTRFLNQPRRLKIDIEGRLQNGQRVY